MSFKALLISCIGTMALVTVYGQYFTPINSDGLSLDVANFELPWADAINACAARNKRLLSVNTPEKDRILVDLFINGRANMTLPGNNTWISGSELREGAWVWKSLEDEPFYYSRWMIGQPDDIENINCIYQSVQALLYWRDANCSAPMYFICE